MAIQNVLVKSNFSKNGYHLVSSCPNTKTEWEARSRWLKCNITNQYHCSPFNTSQLYEFCYERKVLKVLKGHCLGIAENGNLNLDTCKFFFRGCPTEDYYSNELYKYPSCLSIHDNCYTEDCVCNCLTAKKLYVTETQPNDTCTCRSNIITGPCENHQYLPGLVVFVVLFAISVVLNFFFAYSWWSGLKQGDHKNDTRTCIEETQPLEPNAKEIDRTSVSDRQRSNRFEPDDIFRMTLVDFTFEDEQLFNLLKRQCIHGVPSEFEYLVNTRVTPNKKEYIFEQRDENGCILLHYAAQGGNTIILDDILEITSHKILKNKCIRGQCALHFAIKHQQKDMIDHLIKLHSDKKNQNADSTATHQESEIDTIRGEFSPVHLAAWFGNTRLLTSLKENGFDILTKTRNGLNILDIACMKNKCEESDVEFQFCKYLLSNKLLKIDPLKTDLSGWNIVHYASLSNFKLFEYLADSKKNHDLIKKPTKALKTCLHIACEFQKSKIVKLIAEHSQLQTLVPNKDALGWNALHFAAKGGNLKILEYLLNLKVEGMGIGCKTNDGKTLLHIACIHKTTEICRFVIDRFLKDKNLEEDLLNATTTNNGLTAAHYLAVEKKENGSEREILDMLVKTKQMDFSVKSNRGLTVLEFAIDHLNKELIESIVSEYRDELKINNEILDKCIYDTKDERIRRILQTAVDEI